MQFILSVPVDSLVEEGTASSYEPGGGPMREEPGTSPGLAAAPVLGAGTGAGAAPAAGPAPAAPARAVFVDDDGEPFDAAAFFDPGYGPPEGADAWLAQVASPVAYE
jgi:hypothetical protein